MTGSDTRHNDRSWAKVTVRYFPYDLDENDQVQASEVHTVIVTMHGEGLAARIDCKARAKLSATRHKGWRASNGYIVASKVEILDYYMYAREVGIDSQVECINDDGDVS